MSRSGGGGAERQLQLVRGCKPRCTHRDARASRRAAEGTALWELSVPNLRVISDHF